MGEAQGDLAWRLLTELRKEILENQKIRAQVIGFKITFVSAGIGVIVANRATVPPELLVIPAFAAVFFDFLLTSYSVCIKRIGYFSRAYLEPQIRVSSSWPETSPLWEEFMSRPTSGQALSLVGNFGITLLAAGPALIALAKSEASASAALLALVLMSLLIYDYFTFRRPRKITEMGLLSAE